MGGVIYYQYMVPYMVPHMLPYRGPYMVPYMVPYRVPYSHICYYIWYHICYPIWYHIRRPPLVGGHQAVRVNGGSCSPVCSAFMSSSGLGVSVLGSGLPVSWLVGPGYSHLPPIEQPGIPPRHMQNLLHILHICHIEIPSGRTWSLHSIISCPRG